MGSPIKININEKEYIIQKNETKYLLKNQIPDNNLENFVKIEEDVLSNIFVKIIDLLLEKKLPIVIFWEYDKKYLLPSEISYDAFLENGKPHENSAPLYNIFLLVKGLVINNEGDLHAKVKEWKVDSSQRRRDSDILTDELNQFINRIWPENYQIIRIELEESKITIHINDTKSNKRNYYDMEARSQGFKTFISFILTIAAEIENNLIQNCILLLDEPETHLHPSGVRFMRDELLKLSNENNIFYATHSIFMIDRSNLKKYIIVKNDNEVTTLTPVERNNIIQEAVIYEALGTSIDEFSIKPKNILFEGEMDLMLFQFFIGKCLKNKKNSLVDHELLDAGGTKNIKSFFKSKVLPKESEWLIVLDSDSAGRNLKDELDKLKPKPTILKYHFYSDVNDIELEDIMPVEVIEDLVNEIITSEKIAITISFKMNISKSFDANIKEFTERNKIDSSMHIEELFKDNLILFIKNEFSLMDKGNTYEKRKESFITKFPKYYEFLKKIFAENNFNIDTEEYINK